MSVVLSNGHAAKIKELSKSWREYLKSPLGRAEYEDRKSRLKRYISFLSKDKIDDLTKEDFEKLLGDLWANEMWADKGKPMERLLELNNNDWGFIKSQLKELLWADKPISERYDNFRQNVRGLGPASITELLTLVHPDKCIIWNKRAREGLKHLEMENIVPVDKYEISGGQRNIVESWFRKA